MHRNAQSATLPFQQHAVALDAYDARFADAIAFNQALAVEDDKALRWDFIPKMHAQSQWR